MPMYKKGIAQLSDTVQVSLQDRLVEEKEKEKRELSLCTVIKRR